jgi:tetratricopeptide (TPR) repeat protein
MRPSTSWLCAAAFVAVAANAQGAYDVCGSLQNPYGPFDYRTHRDKLEIVERYHFTSRVETLEGGQSGMIGADLDYTLRASPNHHRALMSMVNYMIRNHTDRVRGAHYSMECYFERAIRFAPTDGTVYMIYGTYLFRTGAKDKALKEFETAEKYVGDNANLHYNLGLVYLDAKDYEKALAHAQRAYALGFQLPGLRNKLIAAGKWQDPPTQAPSPAPAASKN